MLAWMKNSRFFLFVSRIPWLPQDAFPLLVMLPLAGFYIIKPSSFEKMWAGYAAIVYAAFFVILTWLHYRLVSKGQVAKTQIAWLGGNRLSGGHLRLSVAPV